MISVIIPVHHAEHSLPACLDSWLAQTCRDLEILCVGHHADPSCQVADAYARRFPQLRVLRRHDGHSAGGNRNRGLEAARGEFVMFADADDVVEPVLLRHMLDALVAYSADMVCCGFDRRTPGRRIASHEVAGNLRLWDRQCDDPLRLAFIYPAPWGKLWRKSRIARLRFTDDVRAINEDCPFFLSTTPSLRRIVLLPEVLYHYTLRPGSLMEQSMPDKSRRFYAMLSHVGRQMRGAAVPASYLRLLEYAAFIHVGIADLHRLAANPAVDARAAVGRALAFLDSEFAGWRHLPLCPGGMLTLRTLAVFCCVQLHRLHCFLPCIRFYNAFSRLTGHIVKW